MQAYTHRQQVYFSFKRKIKNLSRLKHCHSKSMFLFFSVSFFFLSFSFYLKGNWWLQLNEWDHILSSLSFFFFFFLKVWLRKLGSVCHRWSPMWIVQPREDPSLPSATHTYNGWIKSFFIFTEFKFDYIIMLIILLLTTSTKIEYIYTMFSIHFSRLHIARWI